MPNMPPLPRVTRRPDPSPTARVWAPVSYTSRVLGLTPGQSLLMPQGTLQSGFNTPYFIDEIRFSVHTGTDANALVAAPVPDIASMLSFQLQTGSYFFSQAALGSLSTVPMMLYAPTYSGHAQAEGFAQGIGSGTSRFFATRRWVLPKPLWMPPGDLLQATVSRDVLYGSSLSSVDAHVTVVGRALPPDAKPPATRCIPHVGWYVQGLDSSNNALTYSEATAQLQNPFKVPWHVQRIILNTRFNPSSPSNSVGTTAAITEDRTGVTEYVRVRLSDSLGYKITGSTRGGFVPLADVADGINDGAWTFGRAIPPNENFNAAFMLVPGTGTNYNQLQPMISMVGYREEAS